MPPQSQFGSLGFGSNKFVVIAAGYCVLVIKTPEVTIQGLVCCCADSVQDMYYIFIIQYFSSIIMFQILRSKPFHCK